MLAGGDKIILHNSVLDDIMRKFGRLKTPHPLIFTVSVNDSKNKRISHCGVLEFSAPERKAYFPRWMIENLFLEEGTRCTFKLKRLPKGQKVYHTLYNAVSTYYISE